MALGRGTYEQSIQVGAGKGLITTFYLSEVADKDGKPDFTEAVDMQQEIDGLEASGYCIDPEMPYVDKKCGTATVWTNVWWKGKQIEDWDTDWTRRPIP